MDHKPDNTHPDRSTDQAPRLATNLLPWTISGLVHAGLVVIALFVVWRAVRPQAAERQPVIPTAVLDARDPPNLTRRQPAVSRQVQVNRSLPQPSPLAPVQRPTDNRPRQLLGVAGLAGGSTSPFEGGLSTGSDINTRFFGTGGNARKIIYLIDASGSLIDSLDFVILELKRSIHQLVPEQTFTIIFFQGDRVIEVKPTGMRQATYEAKMKVIRWLDPMLGNVIPIGPTNPVPALKRALQYRPELLFILSDNITGSGRYEVDQRRLLDEIARANRSSTRINTIQFLYPDKLERYGLQPTLAAIASQHGGVYRFVQGAELGIE